MIRNRKTKTLDFLFIVYITFVFKQKSETEGTKDDTDDFVCVYKLRGIEDGKIGAFEKT